MQSLQEVFPDLQAVSDTGMTQTDDVVEQREQVQSLTPKKTSPSTPDPITRSSWLRKPPAYFQHYLTSIWNHWDDKGAIREVMFWSVFFMLLSKVITLLILFYVHHSFDSVLCTCMCIAITEVSVFGLLHLHWTIFNLHYNVLTLRWGISSCLTCHFYAKTVHMRTVMELLHSCYHCLYL